MSVLDNQMIPVRNMVDHMVVFTDNDTHRRIVFQPYETKKISAEILRRLNYSHGGSVLLRNYICVMNDELAAEFGVSPETIEYKWTREDIDNCLLNEPIDNLLDALDFGPDGIKEMLVQRAADLKLNDMSKRQALQDATGFDINALISLREQYNQALERDPEGHDGVHERRSTRRSEENKSKRRVQH